MRQKFVRHIVGDMDESMVQRCIICGEIISDYRGVMHVIAKSPLAAAQWHLPSFPAGEIYVANGNPKEYVAGGYYDGEFENCKNL